MSRPRKRSDSVVDTDIFSDTEFDTELFVDAMEEEDVLRSSPLRVRPAWRRLEDWYEQRWMRERLSDWDDWELD